MRRLSLFVTLFALLSLAPACPPTPIPPSPDASALSDSSAPDASRPQADSASPSSSDAFAGDAPYAAECVAACARLAALGCKEGSDPSCVSVCSHVKDTKLTTSCWMNAKTKAEAKACGVACP